MIGEPRLQRIAPEELPELLSRLADEQATNFALLGPRVLLSRDPKEWPRALQGRAVFQVARSLPGLPRELPPDYADVPVLELLDGMDLQQWLERAHKELSPEASADSTDKSALEGGVEVRTVKIFLASSSELREDRDAFDLYFRQQNDRLRKQGIYLEIVRWENFLDAMSTTRMQDEYNQAIRDCDVFVSLFKTKTGQYTAEEFGVAWKRFQATGKPSIYTYFREASVSTSASNRDDLLSLWDFQRRLEELGHFLTKYGSIDGLQRHFRDQLEKLSDEGRL